MKNKILIVYVATGPYNECYRDFSATLENFCPGVEKCVHIFTDDRGKYNKYKEVMKISHVRHMPWPIITLLKFHWIKEAMEANRFGGFTHVCYFNSNIIFRKQVPSEVYLTDKHVGVQHWNLSYYYDAKISDFSNKNERSLAYIKDPKTYCQAGNFCCPWKLAEEMCEFIINIVDTDLSKNIIADWHDESCYQVWIHKMLDEGKLTILGGEYMGCEDEPGDIKRFDPCIVLKHVDKKIINFKKV